MYICQKHRIQSHINCFSVKHFFLMCYLFTFLNMFMINHKQNVKAYLKFSQLSTMYVNNQDVSYLEKLLYKEGTKYDKVVY